MTHNPEIIKQLKICLKDIYERQLEIIGTGIVDQDRQLRVLLLKKELRLEI
jgi:hypothetical protein